MSAEPAPSRPRGPQPIVAIFLTVFIDLLGFGIFIPDLQLRGRDLAFQALGDRAPGWQVGVFTGALIAVFSLAQLLTSPYLGSLSDRVGRRRVLLITSILAAASYALYGLDSLTAVVASRVLSGVAAANLGVAFAYVADVTTPENRAKGLGTLGAAFGLGFLLGPPLGGWLLSLGNNRPILVAIAGTAFALLNVAFIAFLLPESNTVRSSERRTLFADLRTAFGTPALRLLLLMFFCVNLGFTNLETTFFQLLAEPGWIFRQGDGARQTGSIILGVVGITGIFVQGFLVRVLTPKFGEARLLRFAYMVYVPAFLAVPFAPLWIPALIVILALGLGGGLAQPSLSSLVSRSAPRQIQGGVFGITQSLGAVARTLGPLISNPLFNWKPWAPYVVGFLILLFPAISAWQVRLPTDEMPPTDA